MSEGEIGRAHGGPLDAVVHTEETQVRLDGAPTGLFQHRRESVADAVAFVGEAGNGHPHAPDLDGFRPGLAEDVEVGVSREAVMGDTGSLVVSGDNKNRDPGFRHLDEGSERLEDQGRGDPGTVEHVPPVNHQIHPSLPGRRQGPFVVRQEVVTTAPAFHPGAGWQVEAEVGVGQEEGPEGRRPGGRWSGFGRRVGGGVRRRCWMGHWILW